MLKNKFLILGFILFTLNSCVQKAYVKTVIINLATPNKKNIKNAGIRGNGKPLSWQKDYIMKTIVQDSLYTATLVIKTGYAFGEVKFTIDDEWELQDKPNRKIIFSTTSDTTVYNAVFNKE